MKAVTAYGQYCPVARAAEIVADRWTPLLLRELLAGIERFNDLERGLPGISRGLLLQRLRQLEASGVVTREVSAGGRTAAYRLTPAGSELQALIDALGEWGARWAFDEPRPDELDPVLLLWFMRRRIDLTKVPRRKVVIEFRFDKARPPRQWLVVDPGDVSVCLKDPGFDPEIVVSGSLAAFYEAWLGRIAFRRALDEGLIHLAGTPSMTRAFVGWLQRSPMASAVRTTRRR
jgi:DNA-binding HxlR family transcriptional regulator